MSASSTNAGPERPGDGLAGHVLKGSAWMIALRWAIRLIGLASTVILARLLAPADFGIVAMAMLVVGMLELLNQTGQRLAIIRNPQPAREDYDTAWTLSVLVGLVVAGAILLIAPLTLRYFHEPRAVPVMQWLALRAAIGGFENIGTVDFRRDLRFDIFFVYNLVPKLLSFLVTIGCALLWRDYWALVAGILSSQVALVAASFAMHSYRPRFSLARLGSIYSFSTWTLFRTIGVYLNGFADQVVVGGLSGASVMGRYSVAADIAVSPIEEINGPIVAVLYPVMSRVQQDQARLRELFLQTLGWSAVICISVAAGVAFVAHDMVLVVLGHKWLGVEPLVVWLALSGGLLAIGNAAYTTFDALGKPHLGAQMQWVRLLLLVAAIVPVALIWKDAAGIALTRLIVTAAFLPGLLLAIGSEIGSGPREWLNVLWRPAIAAGAMAVVILPLDRLVSAGLLRLLLDVLSGGAVFGVVSFGLWWVAGRPDGPEKDLLRFVGKGWPAGMRFEEKPLKQASTINGG